MPEGTGRTRNPNSFDCYTNSQIPSRRKNCIAWSGGLFGELSGLDSTIHIITLTQGYREDTCLRIWSQ